MDCGHKSLLDAKVVMDDLGRGAKQLAVQETLLTIFMALSYLSWFTPITNMGASTEGAEMMTLLALPFSLLHGGEDTSVLHNILSTSITPLDVGGISLLEDGDGLAIADKLPVLSLDCAFELALSGIMLEHIDHVVEVSESIIVGDNIHFVS